MDDKLNGNGVISEDNHANDEEIEMDESPDQTSRLNGAPPMLRRQMTRRPSFFVEEGDHIIPLRIIGSDNEEILPEDIGVAPDGGWGWVVVFSTFMTSVIFGGTVFTFGVILDAIVENSKARQLANTDEPEVSVSTVAWVGACMVSCSLFCGPFSAALVNKFGFRSVAIAGSFLSSFGFAASWYFSLNGIPNIPALLIFYGFIGGVGISFIFMPSVIIIGFYFEKKRALATGISVCGTGVGTCAFPPILAFFVQQFDWHGTLLIQAGLLLMCALFALLYRPLDLTQNSLGKRVEEEGEDNIEGSDASEENSDQINTDAFVKKLNENPRPSSFTSSLRGRPSSLRTSECIEEESEPESESESESEKSELPKIAEDNEASVSEASSLFEKSEVNVNITQAPERKFTRLQSMGFIGGIGNNARRGSLGFGMPTPNLQTRRISLAFPPPSFDTQETRILRVENKSTFNKPMNRDNIFYRGSIHNSQDINNMDLTFATSELGEVETTPETNGEKTCSVETGLNKNLWREKLKGKLYIVLKMLDFGLMKSPTFILVCLMCGFSLVGLFVPYVYLMGLAQERAHSLEDATFLISIIGISDTVGRIICGIVATSVGEHVMFINNAALTVGGLATLVVPFIDSYTVFIIYACVFGLTNASVQSLRSILLVELLGLSKLTNAFGLTLFCEGIATLFGSPLAGFLRDSTGTYDVTFFTAGGFMLLAGIICYPIYKVKDWEEKRIENEEMKLKGKYV